jgi:hypothetical protein
MGNQERVESRVAGVRVIKWDQHHFGIVVDCTDEAHRLPGRD